MHTGIHHQREFILSEFDRNRMVLLDTGQFITERVTETFHRRRGVLRDIQHIHTVHRKGSDIMTFIRNCLDIKGTITQHIDRS